MTTDASWDAIAMNLQGEICEPRFLSGSVAVQLFKDRLYVAEPNWTPFDPPLRPNMSLRFGAAQYGDIGLLALGVHPFLDAICCAAWSGGDGQRPIRGMLAIGVWPIVASRGPARLTADIVRAARKSMFAEEEGETAVFMKHYFPIEFHHLDFERLAAMLALEGNG